MDFQVKQQLNLMNSYQILRNFLILLYNFNHPLLLYWVTSMQDLNHGSHNDITSREGTDIDPGGLCG